jgi:uncharacterized membrane protein
MMSRLKSAAEAAMEAANSAGRTKRKVWDIGLLLGFSGATAA